MSASKDYLFAHQNRPPRRYYDDWGPAKPEPSSTGSKESQNNMSEGQIVDVSLISKISMRTIKTTPAKLASEQGTPIAVIFGMASGIKEIMDKNQGEVYHALTGQFEAHNLDTGEVFQSGVLYLPSGIHDALEGAVNKLQGDTDFVQFGLQILAVKAKNPAGYSYQAKNLLAAKSVDPLAGMRGELAGSTTSKALTDGGGKGSKKK